MDHQGQRHANGIRAAETTTPAVVVPKLSTNKRSRGGGSGERAVNDDEVDEFFAILKRLQEVKRLRNGGASNPGKDDGETGRSRRCGAITWQPVFKLDDFKDASGGRDRFRRCNDNTTGNARDDVEDDGNEIEVVSRSFDLNAEPEVDRSDELLIN